MRNLITIYSRPGCHLCDVAEDVLIGLQSELDFDMEKISIVGDPELEMKYGEEIPVIMIDGQRHAFYRIDPERFKASLAKHRQRQ
jgi:glutaredoxin